MGNNQTKMKKVYENYFISGKLYNEFLVLDNLIPSLKYHPYINTITTLHDKLVSKMLNLTMILTMEQEKEYAQKFQAIRNIIEKNPVCEVSYMGIRAPIHFKIPDGPIIKYKLEYDSIQSFLLSIHRDYEVQDVILTRGQEVKSIHDLINTKLSLQEILCKVFSP